MILSFKHKRYLLYKHNISLLKEQKISNIFMKQSQEVTSDVHTKKVQIQDESTVSGVCWERNLPDSSSRDHKADDQKKCFYSQAHPSTHFPIAIKDV